MKKVKIVITESECRSEYHKKGDTFIVGDLCPQICSELWNNIYPYVFALRNGAALECGTEHCKTFIAKCPDEGRVCVRGELVEDED